MSVQNARRTLERFLEDPKVRSLALTGRWGVGKTYTWKRVLHAAKVKQVKLPVYSYVSLFGLPDIQAVRRAIFLNAIAPAPEAATDFVAVARHMTDRLKKPATAFLKLAPYLKDSDTAALMVWAARGNLVCLDDLERRPDSLKIKDVMGLVSFLKEECDCKVIVIANDEAFAGEKKDFRRHFEKVFERAVVFEPTPAEAADLVAGDFRAASMVRKATIELGLTNIRLIARIMDYAREVDTALTASADPVLESAIQSLAVLSWSHFDTGTAPPLDFLDEGRAENILRILKDDVAEETPQEMAWRDTLRRVGFRGMSDLDHALRATLEKGYFDPDVLRQVCTDADDNHRRRLLRQPFDRLIDEFDKRWGGSLDDFIPQLEQAVSAAGTALYFSDVDHVCQIFIRLGRPDLAETHARQYLTQVSTHHDSLFYQVDRYHEPFKTLLLEHRREPTDTRGLDEVLRAIEDDEHNHDNQLRIAATHTNDLVQALRAYSGDFTRFFKNLNRPDYPHEALERVVEGLKVLSAENPFDAARAKPYIERYEARTRELARVAPAMARDDQ